MSRRLLTGALALALAAAVWAVPGTSGAFTAVLARPSAAAVTARWFTCTAAFAATRSGTPAAAAVQLQLAEDATSMIATDVSGNGVNGTYTGTHTVLTNPASTGGCGRDTPNAWTLDGTSSFVATSNMASGLTVPFTLSVWVLPVQGSTAGGGIMTLCNTGTGTTCSSRDDRLYLTADGRPVFGTVTSAPTFQTVRGPAALTDGRWHHLAATISASAGMRLYVDGTDVTASSTSGLSQNDTTPTPSDPAGFTTSRATGRRWNIGAGDGSSWPYWAGTLFPGRIAAAAVYRTAFTAAQVRDQWNAGR